MAGSFVAVPEIPDGGITDWQAALLSVIKENVELLCGTRGEPESGSAAIVRRDANVARVGEQDMVQVTARGSGFTISGQDVASLAEFAKLIDDVQRLANDLYRTRQSLDKLIQNLRGDG